MKVAVKLLIFIDLVLSGSCTPVIMTSLEQSLPMTGSNEEIKVFGLNTDIPADAEILGIVKIGDSGFTFTKNCGYQDVLDQAKLEAKNAGGNAIKIIEHIPPGKSTCHRITARILRTNNINNTSIVNGEVKTYNKSYAIFNIYTDSDTANFNYDLHLNDSVICKIRPNMKTTIFIKKIGLNTLWAKIDERSEIQVDIKSGQTYYLRCGILNRDPGKQPIIKIVDSQIGSKVFDLFSHYNNHAILENVPASYKVMPVE
jgi:hypothetical protein